jgi:lipopolysaccharide/colanic/teichoic acid biosynthesis glycosyltransferase
MTPMTPPSSPATLPEASGLYLRLWRAGFRWLYVLDATGILAVTVLVTVGRFGTDWPEPAELVAGMLALTAILQVVFYFGGLYEKQARLGYRMWFARVVGLTLVGLAVGLVVVLPTGRYAVPRANLAAVGVGVVLVATVTRALSRRLRSRRFGPPLVLLVGSSEQTALAASHLSETDRMAVVVAEVPVGAGVVSAADASGATDVVFVDDVSLGDVMPEPLGALDGSGRGVYLRVTATTALLGLRDVREIGGMPYVAIRSRALHPHQLRLKRLVELGVLLVAVPLVVPLLVVAAVYVRLVAGSGVLFRQVRTGRDGVPFTLAKFRTMHHGAEADGSARLAAAGDDRVVRGCRWMRRTRLDELPQVWHVVRGQMSLVGPRPERPELISEFEVAIPGYGRRHEIAPGITGLAQVRAGYHTDPAYKLGHDLQYLMSWSPVLDLQILARTVLVVFRPGS